MKYFTIILSALTGLLFTSDSWAETPEKTEREVQIIAKGDILRNINNYIWEQFKNKHNKPSLTLLNQLTDNINDKNTNIDYNDFYFGQWRRVKNDKSSLMAVYDNGVPGFAIPGIKKGDGRIHVLEMLAGNTNGRLLVDILTGKYISEPQYHGVGISRLWNMTRVAIRSFSMDAALAGLTLEDVKPLLAE